MDPKNKMNENDALKAIVEAADALGWNVAIPDLEDDEEVMGLILGKDGYIDWVTEKIGNEPIPAKLRRKIPGQGEPLN